MNVVVLGAGASKSYSDSVTKVKMPIAKDFFKTFNSLNISQNPWVLIGYVLNYLRDYHKTSYSEFIDYNEDIEVLHSEILERLNSFFRTGVNIRNDPKSILTFSAYMQLIFVFNSVINEIQNGPVSKTHINLAKKLNQNDVVLTFNWDTLMDRALNEGGDWSSDSGYLVKPKKVYRDVWASPVQSEGCKYPLLLKLHGSSNWLTGYLQPDLHELKSTQEVSIEEFYIYESTIKPYSTYDGRYMKGYSDFSYGYYPPNLPLKRETIPGGMSLIRTILKPENFPESTGPSGGLESMPLIIPPVRHKNYSFFGSIFKDLWGQAETSLSEAEKIIIIGYSFPVTDIQTDELFKKAFNRRTTIPKIIIVDPFPDNIVSRFIYGYGIIEQNITVYREYFNSDFDLEQIFN